MKKVSVAQVRKKIELWINLEEASINTLADSDNLQATEMIKSKKVCVETLEVVLAALYGNDTLLNICASKIEANNG